MIPKINFQTSYYLQSRVLSCQYDREILNKFVDKLKYFFNKNENILENIENFTGVSWDIKSLGVWIFQGWYPSISSPILVGTYGEDLDFCFFNLIHEIVHNNIMQVEIKNKLNEWDHVELEAIVNIITINVLKDIFSEEKLSELSLMAEFGGYYKYVWKRVREIQKELGNKLFSKWFKEKYDF